MKRGLCLLSVLILLLSLLGCSAQNKTPAGGVAFYYQQSAIQPAQSGSIISKDMHILSDPDSNYTSILNTYLQGPISDPLHRIFPTGIVLSRLNVEKKNTDVVLGGSFSSLKGMELTIFCACLTLTVCDLTGTQQVSIYYETDYPESDPAVVMRPEEIVLLDDCKIEVDHD